jgi:hypothetical protein
MPDMTAHEAASKTAITTALHRVRFADYHPSPITALAFTPIPFPNPDPAAPVDVIEGQMGALVCARQNGEIQVWEWAEGERSEREGEDEVQVGSEGKGSWVLRRVSLTLFIFVYTCSLVFGPRYHTSTILHLQLKLNEL